MDGIKKSVLAPLVLTLFAALIGGGAGYLVYSVGDLPEVKALEEYRPNITSRVYSDKDTLLAEFFLQNRVPIDIDQAPEYLIKAIVAAEDSRFYDHHGIDVRGIARALYRNIRARKVLEGGSTLTQQLAKVLFLTPEKSYARKLKELALALRIEQHYTKREILSFYLNQIYFGSGAYGVEAAARIYFGKPARDLDLPECALLAGLPRSPKYYSPFRSSTNARNRRAYVLNRMAALNMISTLQADAAKQVSLPVQKPPIVSGPAPYFVEYVRQRVEERLGSGILYTGGLNIHTSINTELQDYAEHAVRNGLEQCESRREKPERQPLQAALIAIEPASGRILAMVGGRDFGKSQFNRAMQAMRQPGSAFKPLVFAAALERGATASDLIDDAPLTVKLDRNKSWVPENFTRSYQGHVTLRRAIAQSLNIPTVRLLDKIGVEEAVRYSRRLGIRSPLTRYLSLALGSSDVTLAELTAAYSVFANHGVRIGPVSILSITDTSGRILYTSDAPPEQVIKPEYAYLITYLLKGVVENGTAWQARDLGMPAAGKTGTTNDFRDAWFIGYTPRLVAGVWVGYDNHDTIGPKETGGRAALPIWLDFMKKAMADRPAEDFTPPDGIVFRQVDPRSGLLSTNACKSTLREAFLAGTEPTSPCDETMQMTDDQMILDEAPAIP